MRKARARNSQIHRPVLIEVKFVAWPESIPQDASDRSILQTICDELEASDFLEAVGTSQALVSLYPADGKKGARIPVVVISKPGANQPSYFSRAFKALGIRPTIAAEKG